MRPAGRTPSRRCSLSKPCLDSVLWCKGLKVPIMAAWASPSAAAGVQIQHACQQAQRAHSPGSNRLKGVGDQIPTGSSFRGMARTEGRARPSLGAGEFLVSAQDLVCVRQHSRGQGQDSRPGCRSGFSRSLLVKQSQSHFFQPSFNPLPETSP